MNLYELVNTAARQWPEATAITEAGRSVTYAELDRRADLAAQRMRDHGVRRGDRVVVWSPKSADVVVALQAALRLGAAYVPVDDASPAERVARLATDCAARLVVGHSDLEAVRSLLSGDCTVAGLAGIARDEPAIPVEPIREAVEADDLAYILYTSGSTGRPKGVCISHRNARAFVDWATDVIGPTPADRLANHAPFTFDLSTLDLYVAFRGGASVHLLPTELSYAPKQLVQVLREEKITVWYSVPSALVLMMRDGGLLDRPAPALRVLAFAGEPFPLPQVRQLREWTNARLLNLYGPTETNVCTWHEVQPDDLERDRPVPIGSASSGDRVWAERADGLVAGPGDEGELVVDGPTVMLGYWNHEPQRGPYRTGDIVRVLPDGAFDYVGRRDHMIKLKGYRIELGDVEASLLTHPGIAEAVVVLRGSGMDARLEAYIVPTDDLPPSLLEIKGHLARRLPRYATVSRLHALTGLPRTRNGKIDRTALTPSPSLQELT